MRANQLTDELPVVSAAGDALSAIGLMADTKVAGLVVEQNDDRPIVLCSLDVLSLVLPPYLRGSPALARACDDAYADAAVARLADMTLAEALALLPVPRDELPPHARLIEVAEVMARRRRDVVPVRMGISGAGVPAVVTSSRVLNALIERGAKQRN